MGCSYESQNQFGIICEEAVYENDLKKRLSDSGLADVYTQVEVLVSYHSFEKLYRLDLVVNQMVYELKAVDVLLPKHEAQALNYAALLNLSRIKLLNFRNQQVTGKLLGSPFHEIDRTTVTIDRSGWKMMTAECSSLSDLFEDLVRKIGGFLEAKLYEEAIIHFYGGKEACVKRLPIIRDGYVLGHHNCNLYSSDAAFVVSTEGNLSIRKSLRNQLNSLLKALPIQTIQWINIHHRNVTFLTLIK